MSSSSNSPYEISSTVISLFFVCMRCLVPWGMWKLSPFFAGRVFSPSTISPSPSMILQYSSLWWWYCRLSCAPGFTVIIFTVVCSL